MVSSSALLGHSEFRVGEFFFLRVCLSLSPFFRHIPFSFCLFLPLYFFLCFCLSCIYYLCFLYLHLFLSSSSLYNFFFVSFSVPILDLSPVIFTFSLCSHCHHPSFIFMHLSVFFLSLCLFCLLLPFFVALVSFPVLNGERGHHFDISVSFIDINVTTFMF